MFPPKVFPPIVFASVAAMTVMAPAFADSAPDAEYLRSTALGPIYASAAYSQSITGAGVTVAVLDSGIDAAHREFATPGKIAAGYNALDGSSNVNDVYGHGTHVAGLLAAARDGSGIVGVAYDARVLPIKVLSDDGAGTTAALDNGLRYAIGRASIANVSLNASQAYDSSVLQLAVRSGLLIVAAAGNDGAANPGWPARFAKEAWANNQIIAVGAVDANNRIASFSNRAGDTAQWFLVAPGVQLMSSYNNGQYQTMSGTSMATPIVSGAAALLKQMWPTLRADQIANILFVTATDLGAPGVDPVYGHGLLNIQRALQPVGLLTTTTGNGRSIVVAGAVLPTPATSALWQLAASGNLHAVGIDGYQRNFNLDLGATVTHPAALTLDQAFGDMEGRVDVADRVLADGAHMTLAYTRQSPAIGAPNATKRLAAFSYVTRNADGRELALGSGGMAANAFGIGALELRGTQGNLALANEPALANPYFSLLPGASYAAMAQRRGGFKIRFGLLTSNANQALSPSPTFQESCIPITSSSLTPKADAAMVEMSQSFDAAAFSLSVARTNETNAYLGTQASGALMLGPGAATTSVSATAAWLLTPWLALAGQASYGITPGTHNETSLITDVSDIRTNAFALALVASDRFRQGDRLGFSVSQPMRTYSGQLVLDVMSGIDGNGAPVRDRMHFSMVPTARELRTELNYQFPLAHEASLRFSALLRSHPNNMEEASSEKLLAVRYAKAF
jgi:hypothetical protein